MIRSIFSVDQRGGLGNKGSLPWPNDRDDMQWFREATEGHVVVMGRRTWDDPKMPKPLDKRTCVVLTTQSYLPNAVTRSGDTVEIVKELQQIHSQKHIWVIGGADLLMETKDICEEMWIAHRKGSYFADARLDIHKYLLGTRITSSKPNQDRTINWCTYRHFFRPL